MKKIFTVSVLFFCFSIIFNTAHAADDATPKIFSKLEGRWNTPTGGNSQMLSLSKKGGEWRVTHYAVHKGCTFSDKKAELVLDGGTLSFTVVDPMPCGVLYKGVFKEVSQGVYEGEISIDFSAKYPLLNAKLVAE